MSLSASIGLSLGSFGLEADLEAVPGEVVGVLGPNGSGKTSLLRAIAGILPVRAGKVVLAGRTLLDTSQGISVPPERRALGMVFQDDVLFPHLNALDNVAFGLRARGASKSEARRQAIHWLERVGLDGADRSRPDQLSGGEAQRVNLARALALEPEALLLDEPLASLDAEARQAIRKDLSGHLRSFGRPVLLVTHDPLEAMTLADRLVILQHGEVVQTGSVAEVTRRPRTAWVARLVGVNLYRGRAAGNVVRLASGQALAVADEGEGEVLVLVHPEAVTLYTDRPAGSPRNVWWGTVGNLERLGHRVRLDIEGGVPMVAEVTAAAVADLGLRPGSEVWAAVKATEIEVYPA